MFTIDPALTDPPPRQACICSVSYLGQPVMWDNSLRASIASGTELGRLGRVCDSCHHGACSRPLWDRQMQVSWETKEFSG